MTPHSHRLTSADHKFSVNISRRGRRESEKKLSPTHLGKYQDGRGGEVALSGH